MKPIIRIVTVFALLISFLSANVTEYAVYAKDADAVQTTDRNQISALDKNKRPILNFDEVKLPAIKEPIDNGLGSLRPGIIIPEDEKEEPSEPLPEEYCMRDDYIIYAQHQDKNGLCWNFAATMAASTTIMKATNEYYDFSELWTGIASYTSTKSTSNVGAGGHFSYQYKAAQKSGLMLESDLPYQTSYLVSNENAEDYYNFYARYSNNDLSELLISDNSTSFSRRDVDAIKEHIYNHGSVYLAFSFSTGFLESDGVYSLTPNQKKTTSNHAISVIGWDDNYQKEFYLDGSDTPTVFKGAWIVLNSYTETNGNDGISMIFYEDTNIYQIKGYRYKKDTTKPLYFYDKIESGYSYPTTVKGKYYGDLLAQTAATKQLNIFYDDVDLEYSYEISSGADINDIRIFLDNKDVTDRFNVSINRETSRFYISGDNATYGNYKVLVTYGNDQESDTYLNNFFVTYGLVGEELEFDYEKNALTFNTGKDLEYYSYTSSNKNYIIYTDKLSGSISFLPIEQSVYSEKNMSMPSISYEIADGKSCTVTHTITANSGYELEYNFLFVYVPDTSLQQVNVYYDLDGGENHVDNYYKELANEETSLILYEPTREGYTFAGWYIEGDDGYVAIPKVGGTYCVDWDDIHHMGEAPTIYASSYYKQYYNNTNILFVHALWEKAEYTVTWQNWDNKIICAEKFEYGEPHVYTGTQPTRPEDERYSYTFLGWTHSTDTTAENVTYTAMFDAVPKRFTVTVMPVENGTVTTNHPGRVTCHDNSTYVFTPNDGYEIKDVKINGLSVGALTNYTFTDVHADQIVEVEFEKVEEDEIAVGLIITLAFVSIASTSAVIVLAIKLRKLGNSGKLSDTEKAE